MKKIVTYIQYFPKIFFFIFIVRPLAYIVLGLNIRGRDNLILDKASIIVANHNSHLDVLIIMSLFPIKNLINVRPVGAMDYFFKSRLRKWFVAFVMDAIPICRTGEIPKSNILEPCEDALKCGQTIIIFPEGTRGKPEHLGQLRKGICHLSNDLPYIPIIPVFLHGLGKSLPKGEALFVPFFVDVFINQAIFNNDDDDLLATIKQNFNENKHSLKK